METTPIQQQHPLLTDDTEARNCKSQKPKRVASLDIFRGLTVAVSSLSLSRVCSFISYLGYSAIHSSKCVYADGDPAEFFSSLLLFSEIRTTVLVLGVADLLKNLHMNNRLGVRVCNLCTELWCMFSP